MMVSVEALELASTRQFVSPFALSGLDCFCPRNRVTRENFSGGFAEYQTCFPHPCTCFMLLKCNDALKYELERSFLCY